MARHAGRLFLFALLAALAGCATPQPSTGRITRLGRIAFEWLEKEAGGGAMNHPPDAALLAWNESYLLMACLAMYEGTGDIRYLERVWDRADRVFRVRDDRLGIRDELRGRVMPAWSTLRQTGGKRHALVAHNGMITFPIARWTYLVRRDPALRTRFGQAADRYLGLIIETARAFDAEWREQPDRRAAFYHGTLIGRAVPINQQSAMGRTFVALWLATGDRQWRARAERLARYLRNRMRKDGDRYVWAYSPEGTNAEDFSHAAINADFAFQCFRAGIVFDGADLRAIANTFKRCAHIRQGFHRYIDGTRDVGLSLAAGRWGHFGFVDPAVRRLIADHYQRGHWDRRPVLGLIAAAYLVETGRPLRLDRPVPLP